MPYTISSPGDLTYELAVNTTVIYQNIKLDMLNFFLPHIPPPFPLHSSQTGLLTISFNMPGMLNLQHPFSQPVTYFPSFIYRLVFLLQMPAPKLLLQKRVPWNYLYFVLFPSDQAYSPSCPPCFIPLHYYSCISLSLTSFLKSNTHRDVTVLPSCKYTSCLGHLVSTSRGVLRTQKVLNKFMYLLKDYSGEEKQTQINSSSGKEGKYGAVYLRKNMNHIFQNVEPLLLYLNSDLSFDLISCEVPTSYAMLNDHQG